jgi:hypothetical protein
MNIKSASYEEYLLKKLQNADEAGGYLTAAMTENDLEILSVALNQIATANNIAINSSTNKMKITLIKTQKFGRVDLKPGCASSEIFLELIGSARKRVIFQQRDIDLIKKLGFDIEVIEKK